MAVKIYKRLKEWWREEKEEVPGSTPDKVQLRRAFLEKASKRVREEEEEFENEDEFEDEESFGGEDAPEFGEENNGEEMVPKDLENPEDIVDGVEGEENADTIADQISLTIDGQNYNLVPAEAEGGDDVGMEDGESADLGIDTNAEMDDVSQPEGEENFNNEENNEEDKEPVEESVKSRIRRRIEARKRARRLRAIREKILARRRALREEDENFFGDDSSAELDVDTSVPDAVMESINKKMARLRRELVSLQSAKRSIAEGVGDLDMPMAKNDNYMQKGGPKKASTPSSSGEDFKKVVGKGEKFAKRGPGTGIKTAVTVSSGGDQQNGAKQPLAKGGAAASGKAYTPSSSGESGIFKAKKLEAVKKRILARRMYMKEQEGLEGMADMNDDMVDEMEDFDNTSFEVAKERGDIQEKLAAIRTRRLARRNESVTKNGVRFPDEAVKADLEATLEESFDFKKLIKGEY